MLGNSARANSEPLDFIDDADGETEREIATYIQICMILVCIFVYVSYVMFVCLTDRKSVV